MWPLRRDIAGLECRRSERVGVAAHEYRDHHFSLHAQPLLEVLPTPRMMLCLSLRIAPWEVTLARQCVRTNASPRSTISLTKPIRSASSALIRRPVITPCATHVARLFAGWGEALRAAGFEPRPPGVKRGDHTRDTSEILARYTTGESILVIARDLGASGAIVTKALREHGVAPRTRSEAQRLRFAREAP